MGKDAPQKAMYEEMKDTPWITQGREIADIGGKGLISNADSVNVFDPNQRYSMEKLNRDVYDRAFEDLNKQYREGMNKYAAANYGRFGTLNATPSAYITDEYNRQYQRDMSNMAYNKAINYENLVNQELQRRYNTLGMYQTLYNMGQIPYELDVRNWQTRNTNKDRDYDNALAQANASIGNRNLLLGGMGKALPYLGDVATMVTGNPLWSMAGNAVGKFAGGMSGSSSDGTDGSSIGSLNTSSSSLPIGGSGNSIIYDTAKNMILGSLGGSLG